MMFILQWHTYVHDEFYCAHNLYWYLHFMIQVGGIFGKD